MLKKSHNAHKNKKKTTPNGKNEQEQIPNLKHFFGQKNANERIFEIVSFGDSLFMRNK